jgi:hypothetical protein
MLLSLGPPGLSQEEGRNPGNLFVNLSTFELFTTFFAINLKFALIFVPV